MKTSYKLVDGGNVPGGHNVLWDIKKKAPFITPMKECNSIPLRHSDVVVDIGAYVGTYSIRCARFPVKKVVAYEPTPNTFGVLDLTRLPNLRNVQAAIVGDDRKKATLHISRGIGVTNSTTLSNRKVDRIEVQALRYEQVVAGASIVKIDVEGAEYDYAIVQPGLRAIIIDFHRVPGNWIEKAEEIVQKIKDAGFSTVIQPDFYASSWGWGGSWIRPLETTGEYGPMLNGELCCGCGRTIGGLAKGLCSNCYSRWSKKHRGGFVCVEVE